MPETIHKGSCFTPPLSHSTITLGVPAYNEAKFIRQTLESIQAQTHKNFAVLISDNASTDGTQAICERIASQDPRFTYVRHPKNMGASSNFEFLKQSTDSPFFAWIGAHDLLNPNYLRHHLEALRNYPNAGVSYTRREYIDLNNTFLRRESNRCIAGAQSFSWFRYIRSIIVPDVCAIHGVFRRAFMSNLTMPAVAGVDHLFLSNSNLLAPFQAIPGNLYLARDWPEGTQSQDYMERITGHKEISRDLSQLINAYLNDYNLIHPFGKYSKCMRPIIRCFLNDSFGYSPIAYGKHLRSLLKRIGKVQSIFGFKPD